MERTLKCKYDGDYIFSLWNVAPSVDHLCAELFRLNVRMWGRGTQLWLQFLLLAACPGLCGAGCGRCSQQLEVLGSIGECKGFSHGWLKHFLYAFKLIWKISKKRLVLIKALTSFFSFSSKSFPFLLKRFGYLGCPMWGFSVCKATGQINSWKNFAIS